MEQQTLGTRLARELATRVATMLGTGTVSISAKGSELELRSSRTEDTESIYVDLLLDSGEDARTQACAVAEVTLSQVQDFVVAVTGRPWPGERSIPLPHAALSDIGIRCWFGDAEHPQADLPPISWESLNLS